jgi:hypothetical protein
VTVPPPSPEAQLVFLSKLQRLFAEGDFTATYKFALLISLADLAVELGRDDGAPLRLSNRQITDKFIDLYWQQAVPYSSDGRGRSHAVLVHVGADPNLSHRADRILSQGWKPVLS